MRMREFSFYYFILFSFFPSILLCQVTSYQGQIITNDKNNDYLLITIQSLRDTKTIYSTYSSDGGKFKFNDIPNGFFNVCVSSIFYEKFCKNVEIPSKKIDTIYLKENVLGLEGVTILGKSKKPFMEFESGILKINVEENPLFSSGTVFEMLFKIPGISYDNISNRFTLNGKAGIVVQHDNRTLYLRGKELMEYLKSMSASDIKEVEINSAPSAKYEASGNSGIINIKTKRIKLEGVRVRVSVSGTQSRFFDETNVLNVQLNTKKNRYLFHYNSAFNKDFEEAGINRVFTNHQYSSQDTYAIVGGNSNNFRGEFEHQFDKSKITFTSNLSFYNEDIPQNTQLDFYSDNRKFSDSTNFSNNNSNNKLTSYFIGGDYSHAEGKAKFSLKANYLAYDIKNKSYLQSFSTPSNFVFDDLENNSPNNINVFLSEIDYSYGLDSISKIELGGKTVFQKLRNQNIFFTISQNDNRSFDKNRSNDYLYEEWILGAYAQYYRKINNLDLTLGLRAEFNPSKGESRMTDFSLKRNQTNFFPYINIGYSYNSENSFNISYNKRITRPAFRHLFPYTYFVDYFTRLTGNPNLKPHISNQIQLQYVRKQKYVFGIGYTFNKNQIYQTPFLDDNFQSSLVPVNIENGRTLTMSANLNFKLFNWWSVNLNSVLFYDHINSQVSDLNLNNWSTQFTSNSQIALPENFKLSFSTDYISSFIQGPYKTDDLFSLNASVSKSFFNGSLFVYLTVNDILDTYEITNKYKNRSESVVLNQNIDIRWIRLSLAYKFQKGFSKARTLNDKTIDKTKERIN